jgi:hypothetical protein
MSPCPRTVPAAEQWSLCEFASSQKTQFASVCDLLLTGPTDLLRV